MFDSPSMTAASLSLTNRPVFVTIAVSLKHDEPALASFSGQAASPGNRADGSALVDIGLSSARSGQ
jgi:hypothetical protein